MFTKWTTEKVKRRANLKTALVARLKTAVVKIIPRFAEIEDEVIPKKAPVIIHHLGNHCSLYSVLGKPVLVELGDGLIFPYLKLPIEYPGLLRSAYCYDEAAKALFRGASLMARGTWGTDETFEKGEIVQIAIVGETIPFAVGVMEMSGAEIEERPDGAAVSLLHILGDGLWRARAM